MIENKTGPTEMLSSNPNVIPLSRSSSMIQSTKLELRRTLAANSCAGGINRWYHYSQKLGFFIYHFLLRTSYFQSFPLSKNLFHSSSIFPFITLGNLC